MYETVVKREQHRPDARRAWLATSRRRAHELVTGPLQAGLFGHARFDTTLGSERLFYFGPEDYRRVPDYEQARAWFNFAALEIDALGSLTLRLVNANGEPVYEATLAPRSP